MGSFLTPPGSSAAGVTVPYAFGFYTTSNNVLVYKYNVTSVTGPSGFPPWTITLKTGTFANSHYAVFIQSWQGGFSSNITAEPVSSTAFTTNYSGGDGFFFLAISASGV